MVALPTACPHRYESGNVCGAPIAFHYVQNDRERGAYPGVTCQRGHFTGGVFGVGAAETPLSEADLPVMEPVDRKGWLAQ